MRAEFTNLQKLRFPLVLRVSKPVEDMNDVLFAETEPVSASLGSLLDNRTSLDELEVKLGLIQLCEALNFVHRTAQMVHLNLNPWSIVLCEPDWKLAGFGFATMAESPLPRTYFDAQPATSAGSHTQNSFKQTPITSPCLDFSAPEVVFVNKATSASDMFALGCLIYRLFWCCKSNPSRSEKDLHIIYASSNVDQYRSALEKMPTADLSHIPPAFRSSLELLLSVDPTKRPTAEELLKSAYFNDTSLKILQYLAHINDHDDRDKAEFLKGLKLALGSITFSSIVLQTKLLPPLLAELRNTILAPLLLPNIFTVIEMIEKADNTATPQRNGIFAAKVLPAIQPLMKVTEPFQITVFFLQRLEFMSKRIAENRVSSSLGPVVYQALVHSNGAVVVLALKELLPILPLLDHESIRTELAPRVLNLIHNPQTPQFTRVQSLFTMSKLVPFAARPFLETSVLPAVLHTLNIDRSSTTITGVIGLCDVVSIKFGTDFTAHRLLPSLLPLLVDPGLGRKQFETTLTILNGMISRISEAKRKTFDELEARAPAEHSSTASDAEKLQAFSSQLPPVTSSLVQSSAPTSAPRASSPSALGAASPKNSVLPSASNQKGAAALTAIISAQEMQKQAIQQKREQSILLEPDMSLSSSSDFPSTLEPPRNSDLFSLDMSAFDLGSMLLPTPSAPGSSAFNAPLQPSNFSEPLFASPAPASESDSLFSTTGSNYDDNDDFFDPRADSKPRNAAPSGPVFTGSTPALLYPAISPSAAQPTSNGSMDIFS